MARKPNYGFEKRRKEQDRKAKKDAKRADRQQRRDDRRAEEAGRAGVTNEESDLEPSAPDELSPSAPED